MSSFATLLLRKVTAVHELADGGVRLDLVALPGVRIDPMPGWITGEPLLDQGVETTMPNLPDIELPDTTPAEFGLEIHAVAADTVRLRVGRPDAGIFADDGTGLGIVTDPAPAPVPFTVTRDEHELVLTTAALSIQVGLYPFRIRVADAESRLVLRTSEFLRQVAGFPMAPAVAIEPAERITLNLEIGPDELVSGFGEQFGPVVKNGQDLVLSIQDALGTGTGLAYKPVPVWQSSRGITGFVNTGTQVRADVGHTRPSVLSLTVPDDTLDLYLVVGPDPKARLASYTALTGRAYVPDPWAFGYWMGRCRYHTAAEMLAVADGMRENEIPCDVLHLDPDWLIVDRLNTDFLWNEERFGDRAEFIRSWPRAGCGCRCGSCRISIRPRPAMRRPARPDTCWWTRPGSR